MTGGTSYCRPSRLQFSERINPLTITGSTFFVQTSSEVRVVGSLTVAADRLSVTFTPTSRQAPSTTYQVRASNITGLAGQAISSFSSSFTTAAQ